MAQALIAAGAGPIRRVRQGTRKHGARRRMLRNIDALRPADLAHAPRWPARGLHIGDGMPFNRALRALISILDTPQFRAGGGAISFRRFVLLNVLDVAAPDIDPRRAAERRPRQARGRRASPAVRAHR